MLLACRQHVTRMPTACHLHTDNSRDAGESLKGSYLAGMPMQQGTVSCAHARLDQSTSAS